VGGERGDVGDETRLRRLSRRTGEGDRVLSREKLARGMAHAGWGLPPVAHAAREDERSWRVEELES
jgi:hypothetical protein